MLKNPH